MVNIPVKFTAFKLVHLQCSVKQQIGIVSPFQVHMLSALYMAFHTVTMRKSN